MSDLTFPLFPTFALLGAILSLIPLPWHLQTWNSGTCFFMLWTSIACLNQFVNSIIWAGNTINHAPWWCEISIRIMMGASVGIPASSLCIVKRLYRIASSHSVSVASNEKRRSFFIDAAICVLFPAIYIALQYVVQGHRFDIFEDIGCFPAIYNTLPAYFINLMWPLLIGLISAVYCALSLREFYKRRVQFNQFLNSNKSLTMSRYIRLMALAMTEMTFTTPLSVLTIVLSAKATSIGPWISWADTHYDYSRIGQVPALFWRSSPLRVVAMELTRWFAPFCAVVFFLYFGFAEEARKRYISAFRYVKGWLGLDPSPFFPSHWSSRRSGRIPAKLVTPLPIYSTPEKLTLTPTSTSKQSFDKISFSTEESTSLHTSISGSAWTDIEALKLKMSFRS